MLVNQKAEQSGLDGHQRSEAAQNFNFLHDSAGARSNTWPQISALFGNWTSDS
jgi:hypothetical protein